MVVAGAVVYFWLNSRLEQSQDNPIHFAAARYGVEPALVKAVVWQESRFNPSVRGGGIGAHADSRRGRPGMGRCRAHQRI